MSVCFSDTSLCQKLWKCRADKHVTRSPLHCRTVFSAPRSLLTASTKEHGCFIRNWAWYANAAAVFFPLHNELWFQESTATAKQSFAKKTTDHDFELGCNRKQGHEGNQQVVLSVNICGYQLWTFCWLSRKEQKTWPHEREYCLTPVQVLIGW